jgi:uncharacterized protein YybS (DUF2232 family)
MKMRQTVLPTLAMSIRTVVAVLCFVTLYLIGSQSLGDLPPILWTPGYATAALASYSAGE